MAIVKGAINKARQKELFDSVAVVLGIGEYVPPIEIKRLFGADMWLVIFELSRSDKHLAHYVENAGFMVTPKGFNMAVTLHNVEYINSLKEAADDE